MKSKYPPIALTEKLDLCKTVASVWLVGETMHSMPITVVLLRGKRPSRLFIEGNHLDKFRPRIDRDIVIRFEWGRINWIITPSTNFLWRTNDSPREMAKYSNHWCGNPGSCSHWSHLFDEDMPLRAIELCLQEVARNYNKASLADIVARIVILGGKRGWKSWAKGPVAAFYVHAPQDTGEDYRYIFINCIQGLPTLHLNWLDDLVMIGAEKGRIVFGYPKVGTLEMTLRQFLASQGIK